MVPVVCKKAPVINYKPKQKPWKIFIESYAIWHTERADFQKQVYLLNR